MKLFALITLAFAAVAVASPQNPLEALDDNDDNGPNCVTNDDCVGEAFGFFCQALNPQQKKCRCRIGENDCALGQTCKETANKGYGKCKDSSNPDDEEPKCTIDDTEKCSPNKPFCLVDENDSSDNKCVECLETSHCDEGETCEDNKCKDPPPPPPPVCTKDEDCSEPNPFCLVDADSSKNKCVACTETSQCPGGTCNASNVCVPNTPAPIPCGAYGKCPTGRYCKRTGSTKSCVVGCKVKRAVCKTTANKLGKCNNSNQCIVPAKKRGSPCSKKVVNDCGTGFKCVTPKKSYKGACHKVVAAGATCGKGRFPDLCPTGSKCKYHKCTTPAATTA